MLPATIGAALVAAAWSVRLGTTSLALAPALALGLIAALTTRLVETAGAPRALAGVARQAEWPGFLAAALFVGLGPAGALLRAHPEHVVPAALFVGTLAAAGRSLDDPDDARAGLALSGLAGLSVSEPHVVAPCAWGALAWSAWRALRRGARWPVIAPTVFMAALLVAFAVATAPRPSLGDLLARLSMAPARRALAAGPPHEPWRRLFDLTAIVGVVPLLLMAVGAITLVARARLHAVLLLAAGVLAAWSRAPVEPSLALLALLALGAVPLAAGTGALAARLGRAAPAAAAAMAAIALVEPILSGYLR